MKSITLRRSLERIAKALGSVYKIVKVVYDIYALIHTGH
jgi:hypothetical protein